MTLYELLWYFFLYGFMGWCLEVVYHVLETGAWANRGFLNGALCPIYGLGTLGVILTLEPVSDNLPLLFLGATLLCTLLELLTGLALDKGFHQRWWDYSKEFMNFKGYISLKYSIYWGLGCVFILHLVHPSIQGWVAKIPTTLGWVLLAMAGMAMVLDMVDTFRTVVGINRELRAVHEAASAIRHLSDDLSEKIYEGTLRAMEEKESLELQMTLGKAELSDKAEELRNKAEELRNKAEELARRFRRGQGRMFRAFPSMRSTRYGEDLAALKELIEKVKKK